MEARTLIIEDRVKVDIGAVKPSDFKYLDAGVIDPQIVLHDPNLSLYCLDFEKRTALFVETPPECDLSRVPFYYQTQYEAALRIIEIPFETLHQLAAEAAIDPAKLILIYSVGRCGSTLISRAFNEIESVHSLSEPDVFSQMLTEWGVIDLEGIEKESLLKSCILLQCMPGKIKGAAAWALKFRGMVTVMASLFYSVFPEAKPVFIYRNIEPWFRSFMRMVQISDPHEPIPLAHLRSQWGRLVNESDTRETMTFLELSAFTYLSSMEKCIEMQRLKIPMFITRYEELSSAPKEVINQMFSFCGLPGISADKLDELLKKDSQAGSTLSRESIANTPITLSREHLDELKLFISSGNERMTEDTVIPGTYCPKNS